jgi:hypothetical protein
MGRTKKAVEDSDFYQKMLRCCTNDEQRGLVTILDMTGMRVSGLCGLTPSSLVYVDGKPGIQWREPQTGLLFKTQVDGRKLHNVECFLRSRRKTRRHYYNLIRQIGARAGFEDVSPMTFFHNYEGYGLGSGRNPVLCVREHVPPPELSRTPFEQWMRREGLTRAKIKRNMEGSAARQERARR